MEGAPTATLGRCPLRPHAVAARSRSAPLTGPPSPAAPAPALGAQARAPRGFCACRRRLRAGLVGRSAEAPRRFVLSACATRAARAAARAPARRRAGRPWSPLRAPGPTAPTGRARPARGPGVGRPRRRAAAARRAAPRGLRRARRLPPAPARCRRPRAAAQAPGQRAPPAIVTARRSGAATPAARRAQLRRGAVAFVHHTVSANDYGPSGLGRIVLAICRVPPRHHGWNDIGYNFLVDKYGQVFEGRAGGIDRRSSARRPGLQQRVDRHREHRHVHRPSSRRRRRSTRSRA